MNKILTNLIFSLILTAISCFVIQAQSDPSKTIGKAMQKETFIIIYKPGTAWINGKPVTEQPLKEHGKFLLDLYKSKILLYAGPFGDDTGGAAVIEMSNVEEAKKIVERDPAVTSKVMIYEIHPWKLVPWENYVKK